MAGLGAVHGVGESIVRHLRASYQQDRAAQAVLAPELRVLPDCAFEQVSSGQLAADFAPANTLITLFLYRLGVDAWLRTTPAPGTPHLPASRPLSLELHYLFSVWADSAAAEHTVLSWVMRELHQRPIFDHALLEPPALWEPGEEVRVVPSELSHEDMMRVWDALAPAYRLSVSYVARVVRLTRDPLPAQRPVVATRYAIEPLPERPDA